MEMETRKKLRCGRTQEEGKIPAGRAHLSPRSFIKMKVKEDY